MRGGALRDRVLLGAEGSTLYGEIKKAEGQKSLGLFGIVGDDQMERLERAVRMMNRETVLVLNATPDDQGRLRADKEAALLDRQLETVANRERDLHVVQKFAVRLQDIQKELLNNRPKSCTSASHGDEGVLCSKRMTALQPNSTGVSLPIFLKLTATSNASFYMPATPTR